MDEFQNFIRNGECSLQLCRESIGMQKKTWLEASQLSFRNTLKFIYLWCQELISIELGELQLQIKPSTTVDWKEQRYFLIIS